MEGIRKQLQCRSCMLPLFPPIYICQKGESVCEECRKKYGRCPLCKGKITKNINTALEELAKFPCFNCNKCNAPLKLIELKEHFSMCLVRKSVEEATCPIQKCTWKGNFSELPDHWLSKKLSLQPYVDDNICHAKLNTKHSYFANMVKAYDSVFFFKSWCNDGKFFWALQYVGADAHVEKFSYEIEILNPNRVECKFILSSFCQSMNLSNASLFKEGVCITTPKEMLEPYLADNDTLLYKFRVRQVNVNELENERRKVTKLLEKHAKK